MELLPIRKPRPFAGETGKSIKDLYSSIHGAIGIISIRSFNNSKSNYNTEAVVLMEEATLSSPAVERTVLYSRLELQGVFAKAGFSLEEGVTIKPSVEVSHPIEPVELIKLLNSTCKCDFETSDFTVTHTDANQYTLVCEPDSLGYFGSIDITVGDAEKVLVSTENALMYSQDSVVTADGVTINGVAVDLTANEQIKNTGVLFKEFETEAGKLTYLLNLNPHSLSVDLATKDYKAADANINETVTLENGNIILYKFTEPTVDVPIEPIQTGTRIRATTWLNNEIELSQVFRISINGVNKSVAELIASEEVELLLVGNVVELTNLTGSTLLVELRARTISLPGVENPEYKFITFDDGYESEGDYEVYKFQMAAATNPALPPNVLLEHPSVEIYEALAEKLGVEINKPTDVDRNDAGEVIKVRYINDGIDRYSLYDALLKDGNSFINGQSFYSDVDIFKYALKRLVTLVIQKETVARTIDNVVDTNQVLFTIVSHLNTDKVKRQDITYNDLQRFSIRDAAGNIHMGFITEISNGDEYELIFPDNFGVVRGATLPFVFTYNNSGVIYPEIRYLDKSLVAILNGVNEELNLPSPPEFITLPTDGLSNITIEVDPTEAELEAGKIDYSFNFCLMYNGEVTKLFDYLDFSNVDLSKPLLSVEANDDNQQTTGYLNVEPLSISVEDYLDDGYGNIRTEDGGYVIIGTMSGMVNLRGLTYTDGVSRHSFESNEFTISADLDGVNARVFNGAIYKDRPITVTNYVTLSKVDTPTMSYPDDMADILKQVSVESLWNQPGKHSVREVTSNNVLVNVAAPLIGLPVMMVPVELSLSFIEMMELSANNDVRVTISFTNINGTLVKIVDNKPIMEVFNTIIGDRVFTLIDAGITNPHTISIDVDGDGTRYESVEYVFNHETRYINEPVDTTMIVHPELDDEVKEKLLSLPAVDKNTISNGPFLLHSTPTKVIDDCVVTYEEAKTVIDGTIKDVDPNRDETVAILFQMWILEEELWDNRPDTDVVGTLSTVGDNPVTVELTRGLFRDQSLVIDGNVCVYMLLQLNKETPILGDYEIVIDWDGYGSDDTYVIDKDEDFNLYLKQTINFQVDVGVEYKGEEDLQISCEGTASFTEVDADDPVSGYLVYSDTSDYEFRDKEELISGLQNRFTVVELEPWQQIM